LLQAFEALRAQVLSRPCDPATVLADVSAMRQRMRVELDRSDAAVFDIKQGEGGLVDLEFLLQALVLRDAAAQPALLGPCATPTLLDAVLATGAITPETHASLLAAHASLLDAGMRCTLDRRPRRVPLTPEVEAARSAIRDAVRAQGLVFDAHEKGAREKGSE
jgi:glutamate-ammonia-ligase adenylyltransferase